MQIQSRHYPHPVLSPFTDDLQNCLFETTFEVMPTRNSYQFHVKWTLTSEDMLEMINHGNAVFALHIESKGTRYRLLHKSNAKEATFEIPAEQLDGRVEVCSFVLATAPLPQYHNRNFHADYEDVTFEVMKGDVLAIDKEFSFLAPKEMDPLKKVPSIFTVCLNNVKGAPAFDLDTNEHKVVIKLSKENFAQYKLLSQNPAYQKVLSTLIILPALVSLLEILKADAMQDALYQYEDSRWYQSLQNKLSRIGIDLATSADSALWIAQQLIGNPLQEAMKSLEAIGSEN